MNINRIKPSVKTYTSKSGKQLYKPSQSYAEDLAKDQEGFCLACGESASGVEPDARKYKCEICGELKVYGAEELMLMGLTF